MSNVRIFTTRTCGFCVRAKQFFESKGVDFEEIDVTGDDEARQKLVRDSGGQRTVPQIWIGSTHVGGYTDLVKLDQDGKLQGVLDKELGGAAG